LARDAVAARLEGRALPASQSDPALARPAGVFVSLHHRRTGELRGCIGHVEAERPLAEVVPEMAVAAACVDTRFPAVTARELPDLVIEVSVLGPSRPIPPEAVEPGRHGLIVSLGRRLGLLLPQVAAEQGWTREELLDGVCRKAGLPRGAWREPACRLEAFTAEVFGEGEEPEPPTSR
jgi:AmmeMemoRadiSam system protein A